MSRVKVKKMIPKGMDADQETLTELFEQMTGVKDADAEILIPKYCNVMSLLKKFYKLYSLLANLDAFSQSFSDYPWVEEINKFLEKMRRDCNLDLEKSYSEDVIKKEIYDKFYSDIHTDAKIDHKKLMTAEAVSKDYVNKIYKNVKQSDVIKNIMITSSNLAPFKIHLCVDVVSDKFILREPGNIFCPLSFTSLDLKLIWNVDAGPKCKTLLLNILQHTFKISYEIYDIIYSPDVDIAKFSDLLIGTITKLRSQIPRCDKAFDVIESSVNLLRTNFKDYFRISVESENPSSILESFIIDVAGTQKANPLVVTQFRKITAFMKKNAGNSNDPRIKQLFKMLNTQFSKIDKEMNINTTTTPDLNPESDPVNAAANAATDTNEDNLTSTAE